MIRWKGAPAAQVEAAPKGFDDYELKLGDILRGERATLSKSLLDVQRELRIKAVHIAAIENGDVAAFESPSFIAGYVRSYARYLGVDPDWAFERFCRETGFAPMHGLAPGASGPKPQRRPADLTESLANPNASFIPKQAPLLSKIDPRAIGSLAVVVMVAGGIGYGGWSVLQEVQRVQLAPVEQAPGVVAEIDPLQSVNPVQVATAAEPLPEVPTTEAFDRLYRPAALETPVLIARDGPIAAIDPRATGLLAGAAAVATPAPTATVPVRVASAEASPGLPVPAPAVRTLGAESPEVEVLAVRPAWVRITAADGSVIYEGVMDAGARVAVPKLQEAPKLRTGESGAVYLAVNGVAHGPVGPKGAVTKNIELSPAALAQTYAVADLAAEPELAQFVAVADASAVLSRSVQSPDSVGTDQ